MYITLTKLWKAGYGMTVMFANVDDDDNATYMFWFTCHFKLICGLTEKEKQVLSVVCNKWREKT